MASWDARRVQVRRGARRGLSGRKEMPRTVLTAAPSKAFHYPGPKHPLLMWPPHLGHHPITPE